MASLVSKWLRVLVSPLTAISYGQAQKKIDETLNQPVVFTTDFFDSQEFTDIVFGLSELRESPDYVSYTRKVLEALLKSKEIYIQTGKKDLLTDAISEILHRTTPSKRAEVAKGIDSLRPLLEQDKDANYFILGLMGWQDDDAKSDPGLSKR